MSQENVEIVRSIYEAWNADDLDAFLAELDADVEWHPAIEPGLEGRQLPTEVMTARERFGDRTAARRGNATPLGLRSSATSASRSSRSVTWT
jgi:ketosteroid isomerase-like protein